MFKSLKIILLVLVTSVNNLLAQDISQYINVLQKKIDSTSVPIEKIKLNIEVARIYLDPNPTKSLNYLTEATKWFRKTTPMPSIMAELYETYGIAYKNLNNTKLALYYFDKQLTELQKYAEQNVIDSAKFNFATMAYETGDYIKAKKYFTDVLNSPGMHKNTDILARIYNSLYLICKQTKDYQGAVENLEKYLKIIDSKFFNASQNLSVITTKYTVQNYNLNEIKTNLQQTKQKLITTTNILKVTDSSLQNTMEEVLRLQKDSLQYAITIIQLKDDSLQNAIKLIKTEDQKRLQEQQLKNSHQAILYLIAGLAIIIISLIFIFRINGKINKQNKILKEQKEIIENKNKLINDSINYASYIQQSIVSKPNELVKILPQSFVYFNPRSKVSGDFLWFDEINGSIIIAAVDCTGHGVPGAFLSIVANNILNDIVKHKEITKPSEILNNLHFDFLKTLQRSNEDEIDDGMDLVLCTINKNTKKMEYAGAHNGLLVYKNNEFISLKTTPYSIGQMPFRPSMPIIFNNFEYDFDNETFIFLMTDGYNDQFGTDNFSGEQFGMNRFYEMISTNLKLFKIEYFEEILSKYMNEWKKEAEQTDDMLVVGINLSKIS